MQLNPMLTFNGQCEAAFKFYEKRLGGSIVTMLSYGDTPMAEQVPSEWRNKIVHATIKVGDTLLMGSDALPEDYQQPRGCSIVLQVNDTADTERLFNALAENATVQMPIQKTFWSPSFGMLVDQFGIPWMLNCEQTS